MCLCAGTMLATAAKRSSPAAPGDERTGHRALSDKSRTRSMVGAKRGFCEMMDVVERIL